MPLKSRNNHPPGGGFSFYQPETKWSLRGGLPFESAVREIINHRKANPALNLATDPTVVSDELDAYTCARLRYDEHWCEKKTVEVPWNIPSFSPPPLLPGAEPAAAEPEGTKTSIWKRAAQIVGGVSTLTSWIGHGASTVVQAEADRRASICQTCPKNVPGNLVEIVTGGIAEAIKSAIQLKRHLKLKTQVDDELGTCDACGCHLGLKVWVSPDEVKKSLTPEIVSELVPQCWMRKL